MWCFYWHHLFITFSSVQVILFWTLLLWTLASVLFWLQPRLAIPRGGTVATLIVLTLGSFQRAGVKLQQLTLLVALTRLCLCCWYAADGMLGILLAVCTIKPQLTACLSPGYFCGRWKLEGALAFCDSICRHHGVLFSVPTGFPRWIPRFINALSAYRQYTGGAATSLECYSPFAGHTLGVCHSILLAMCWRLRKVEPGSSALLINRWFGGHITTSAQSRAPTTIFFFYPPCSSSFNAGFLLRLPVFASATLAAIIMLGMAWLASVHWYVHLSFCRQKSSYEAGWSRCTQASECLRQSWLADSPCDFAMEPESFCFAVNLLSLPIPCIRTRTLLNGQGA